MKLYFKYYLTQNCSKKIAVVLSGCGVYDGSEVHEASACLAAITRNNIEPVVFAPRMKQVSICHLPLIIFYLRLYCNVVDSLQAYTILADTACLYLVEADEGSFKASLGIT